MNIGIRMHDMTPGTLEERAAIACTQGFSCVHLALSKTIDPAYMDPAVATPGLASYVRKAMQGLDVAVLGCYLNLAHPDEKTYQEIVRKYVAHLQLCRWLCPLRSVSGCLSVLFSSTIYSAKCAGSDHSWLSILFRCTVKPYTSCARRSMKSRAASALSGTVSSSVI